MICASQGGICLKSSPETEWRMLDFCIVSSWIFLPPASQRKLASCFPAVRIRYNYQFIPRIIPPAMTVKEPTPRASEMESERIENRKVVEQRIKRPGKREDRSCPRIQELSILSWSHLASSEFWFISYVIWPLSRNNLLYKESKDVREIVDLPFSTRLTPISWKRQYFIKKHQEKLVFLVWSPDRRLSNIILRNDTKK